MFFRMVWIFDFLISDFSDYIILYTLSDVCIFLSDNIPPPRSSGAPLPGEASHGGQIRPVFNFQDVRGSGALLQ